MKTTKQLPVLILHVRLLLAWIMALLLVFSLIREAAAQSSDRFQNDPYFPAKSRFQAGLITTYRGPSVPAPVAIGEFTYGFGKKFSMGIVGGTTGTLSLAGLRLAGNFYQKNNFRLLGHLSIIYYPERNGTYLFDQSHKEVMPWMLSMGFLDAEWKLRNGVRLSGGMGLLETHCIDGMMSLLFGAESDEDDEAEFQFFNTMRASVAIPLSKRLTLQPEAIAVMNGFKIVPQNVEKIAPLYLYLHLVYTF